MEKNKMHHANRSQKRENMKKQFFLLSSVLLMSFTTVLAQEGRQRLSAEERTKMAIEKIAPLNLDTATKAKTAMVLKEFY